MTDENLKNAQKDLARRRRREGVTLPQPAATFLDRSLKESSEPVDPERPGADTFQPEKAPERVTINSLEITHPKIQEAVDMVRAWADRKRQGQLDASLVFMGPYGTGKTHLAHAVLWSMCQVAMDDDGEPIPGTERPAGRFFAANDLIQRLDARTWCSSLIGDVPVLVVDDVGAEQRIDYAGGDDGQRREKQHRYFKIVNYCYDWQISLVVTSNLDVAGLRECLGGRAWSRLGQMAPKGFMVDLTGVPDYRLQQSGR